MNFWKYDCNFKKVHLLLENRKTTCKCLLQQDQMILYLQWTLLTFSYVVVNPCMTSIYKHIQQYPNCQCTNIVVIHNIPKNTPMQETQTCFCSLLLVICICKWDNPCYSKSRLLGQKNRLQNNHFMHLIVLKFFYI